MTTDYKVTSLFCVIDDFCKLFEAENAGHLLLEEDGVRRRRRKTSLSDSEIITILLYFHFGAENGGYPPTQNGDIRSLFWLFSLMALQN